MGTGWGRRIAHDLKPEKCRGGQLFFRSEFLKGFVSRAGLSKVYKMSSQDRLLQRTVEQTLDESCVPRERTQQRTAKPYDFIQELDVLFNHQAVFENIFDCRLRRRRSGLF